METRTVHSFASTIANPILTYQIDPQHTAAHFKVRHMMISYVRGQFSGISGAVAFDPANLAASRIEARIDTATVSTREPTRDKHLKSADFLDVARYPAITFHSTKIVSVGDNRYDVSGNLAIHGVTREATLHVNALTPEIKDPDGRLRRGAAANTRIQRKDFELTWNVVLESGGFLVGDEVDITIDVELIRNPE
jgi:polyisoprenoid-binding protein YceI